GRTTTWDRALYNKFLRFSNEAPAVAEHSPARASRNLHLAEFWAAHGDEVRGLWDVHSIRFHQGGGSGRRDVLDESLGCCGLLRLGVDRRVEHQRLLEFLRHRAGVIDAGNAGQRVADKERELGLALGDRRGHI